MSNFAGRFFNRKQALEREVKDAYVKLSANGTSAPTIVSGVGSVSIARNGAGDYSLTLSDKYPSLKSFKATLMDNSAEDVRFQVHSETVSTTKVIRFLALTGATPTDIAQDSVVFIKLELKNTQGF